MLLFSFWTCRWTRTVLSVKVGCGVQKGIQCKLPRKRQTEITMPHHLALQQYKKTEWFALGITLKSILQGVPLTKRAVQKCHLIFLKRIVSLQSVGKLKWVSLSLQRKNSLPPMLWSSRIWQIKRGSSVTVFTAVILYRTSSESGW